MCAEAKMPAAKSAATAGIIDRRLTNEQVRIAFPHINAIRDCAKPES